jgi:alpha-ketoglutarate-dependent taurine dioxygenase
MCSGYSAYGRDFVDNFTGWRLKGGSIQVVENLVVLHVREGDCWRFEALSSHVNNVL